jgi:hypothetical protein
MLTFVANAAKNPTFSLFEWTLQQHTIQQFPPEDKIHF